MNNLVELNNERVVTTSLVVADSFGKEHKNVIQSIENLTAENPAVKNMFEESVYTNERNRQYPMYYINRDGFTLLAMGFTGKKALQFKLDYIQAFNTMESMLEDVTKLHIEQNNERLTSLETTVDSLANNLTIDYSQQKRFEDARKVVVPDALGGYGSNPYGKKVFTACGKDVKQRFGIPRYNELPRQDFEAAIGYGVRMETSTVVSVRNCDDNGQSELTI